MLTDTAGLRDSDDVIEQEGIRRANRALGEADLVLWLNETALPDAAALASVRAQLAAGASLLLVHNKIDQQNLEPYRSRGEDGLTTVGLSALTGAGIETLIATIKEQVGYGGGSESVFSARERHLQALAQTHTALQQALASAETAPTLELIAENLRQAQDAMTALTGEFSADDLLGEIFARFCIGK